MGLYVWKVRRSSCKVNHENFYLHNSWTTQVRRTPRALLRSVKWWLRVVVKWKICPHISVECAIIRGQKLVKAWDFVEGHGWWTLMFRKQKKEAVITQLYMVESAPKLTGMMRLPPWKHLHANIQLSCIYLSLFQIPPSLLVWFCPPPWLSSPTLITFTLLPRVYVYSPCVSRVCCQFVFCPCTELCCQSTLLPCLLSVSFALESAPSSIPAAMHSHKWNEQCVNIWMISKIS